MSDNTSAIQCISEMGTFNGISSPSSKNLGMDNYSLKLSFVSSHSRETKHSCWQGISVKSRWYWIDAQIKAFESGVKIFMFQTKSRSICYQY